jgi:membrane-associated phospholipid phosphatase
MKIDIFRELKYFYSVAMRDFSLFGSFVYFAFALTLLLILNQTNFAVKVIIGIVVITSIEILIKLFYRHKRPDFKKVKPSSAFENFEENTTFPSGHTGKATLFAVLIHSNYMNIYLTLLFATMAVLVGLSRITKHRHYVIDVVGGWVLGIVVGSLI